MDTPLDLPPSCENRPGPAIALYPGTFDPITYGHIDIIRRGLCSIYVENNKAVMAPIVASIRDRLKL